MKKNYELKFLNKLKINIETSDQVQYNYDLFLKYLKNIKTKELVVLRVAEVIFRDANIFIEDVTLDNINDYVTKTMLYATQNNVEPIVAIPMLGYIYKRYLTKDNLLNYDELKDKEINNERD